MSHQGWILVSDKLPEYDTDVMLYNGSWGKAYIGYLQHSGEWIGRYRPEDDSELPGTNPTHWCSLPAPPMPSESCLCQFAIANWDGKTHDKRCSNAHTNKSGCPTHRAGWDCPVCGPK